MNREDGTNSKTCFESPSNSAEVFMMLSMVSVFVGLAISTVGYVVPRDHAADPALSAREQEALDIYYNKLYFNLDVCIVVGMCFIGLGGLITSAIFCKRVILGGCEEEQREDTYTLTDHQAGVSGQGQEAVPGTTGQYRTFDR